MEGSSLVRFRWRLRGAWLWPSFVALTVLDGLLIHWRPLTGDNTPVVAGWLIGVFASLIATVVLSAPLGKLLRLVRRDMPRVVARNYAGASLIVAVTVLIAAIGFVHHPVTVSDEAALQDATARAEAYIGARAPNQFRTHLQNLDVYQLQPPRLYRVCASNAQGSTSYCVVVDRDKPFGKSVTFSGHEPNSLLSQGTS